MRGLCLAIACFFSPLLAEGQVDARLGGGPGMPIGDLADGTEAAGPFLLAGLAVPVDIGYFLLFEGHHSRFGTDEEEFAHLNGRMESDADRKMTGGNVGLLIQGIADPVGFYGHGGVGWARATGRSGRSDEGEDAESTASDSSFMFVIGLGVNLTVSNHVGLSLETRYNHVFEVFNESARWIPVTASVVIQLKP